MPVYLIAIGHNIPIEDLAPMDPQPATPGMLHGRRQYPASGDVIDELPYVPLNFGVLEDIATYQALCAQFDLMDNDTSPVSVYVQDKRYNWVLRNATAVYPEIGPDGQRTEYLLREFVILLRNLKAQA